MAVGVLGRPVVAILEESEMKKIALVFASFFLRCDVYAVRLRCKWYLIISIVPFKLSDLIGSKAASNLRTCGSVSNGVFF